MIQRLLHDRKGGSVVEFALLLPTFLMFIFLLLDGGRMMFAKQSLNELASATARCAAIKQVGCDTADNIKTWAINRGLTRSNLQLSATNITITTPTSCSTVGNMTQVTVSMPWKRGAMTFLPQSIAPATLSATSCFPIMTTS